MSSTGGGGMMMMMMMGASNTDNIMSVFCVVLYQQWILNIIGRFLRIYQKIVGLLKKK